MHLIRFVGCRRRGALLGSGGVDAAEELLRRLALNDEAAGARVLTGAPIGRPGTDSLSPQCAHLVRLGALLALGAAAASLKSAVDLARAAGATDEQIVAVLVAVGPAMGLAQLVSTAARLAVAIGYDTNDSV